MRVALIAGASGLIGKFCLSYLLMDKRYDKVIAVVRKELPLKDPKLEQVIVDFRKLDQYAEQLKADDIFCCLGTTIAIAGSKERFKEVDLDYVLKLAELGIRNGAKKFSVVSAMGADQDSKLFYNRIKGEMEEGLKKLRYSALHIFRPSMLMGIRKEFRLAERIGQVVLNSISFMMVGGMKKYKPIDAMVVAYAMIEKTQEDKKGVFTYSSDEIQKRFDNK